MENRRMITHMVNRLSYIGHGPNAIAQWLMGEDKRTGDVLE